MQGFRFSFELCSMVNQCMLEDIDSVVRARIQMKAQPCLDLPLHSFSIIPSTLCLNLFIISDKILPVKISCSSSLSHFSHVCHHENPVSSPSCASSYDITPHHRIGCHCGFQKSPALPFPTNSYWGYRQAVLEESRWITRRVTG